MNKNNNAIAVAFVERTLSKLDQQHQAYLCEYGLIHLKWGSKDLVYCPGDFLGLPFLLSNALSRCDLEGARGKASPEEQAGGIVRLDYASVHIPLEIEDCRRMHTLVKEASKQLMNLILENDASPPTFYF